MIQSWRIALVAILTLTACHIALADDLPEGFEPLFNGSDLAGWHGEATMDPVALGAMGPAEREKKLVEWDADAREHWSVEDGELVNDGHGVFLTTDKPYGDIELVLEYKTVARADSGVYLRATPQVQIWDYTEPEKFKLGADQGSGALWNNTEGARGKYPFVLADRPFGEWNKLRVRQVGARTTVWLNDQLVVDNATMENYWDRAAPLVRRAPIQLQTHGGEIRWRNLGIREIAASEANELLSGFQAQAFEPLFNGKDLTGWHGATDSYEVTGGAIRCKDGHGGLLLAKPELKNFVARIEFRLPPGGNNGLAIRSPGTGDTAYEGMCELQVLDTEHPKYASIDPRQAHGSAYGIAAARQGYLRPTGEWNFQEVTVDGSRVKVELNGNVILDADLAEAKEFMADSPHPGITRTSGYFGFAGHSDPVEFRNVSIKRLAD